MQHSNYEARKKIPGNNFIYIQSYKHNPQGVWFQLFMLNLIKIQHSATRPFVFFNIYTLNSQHLIQSTTSEKKCLNLFDSNIE